MGGAYMRALPDRGKPTRLIGRSFDLNGNSQCQIRPWGCRLWPWRPGHLLLPAVERAVWGKSVVLEVCPDGAVAWVPAPRPHFHLLRRLHSVVDRGPCRQCRGALLDLLGWNYDDAGGKADSRVWTWSSKCLRVPSSCRTPGRDARRSSPRSPKSLKRESWQSARGGWGLWAAKNLINLLGSHVLKPPARGVLQEEALKALTEGYGPARKASLSDRWSVLRCLLHGWRPWR